MRPADLVFWLDTLGDDDVEQRAGVLCRRHADSMVVPRDWTLDDLRDPELRLFRPPQSTPASTPARRASRRRPTVDQLELGIDPDTVDDAPPVESSPNGADGPSADDPPAPWTPSFDSDDDLDGLLAARSPLLSRAFRGADRPRSS